MGSMTSMSSTSEISAASCPIPRDMNTSSERRMMEGNQFESRLSYTRPTSSNSNRHGSREDNQKEAPTFTPTTLIAATQDGSRAMEDADRPPKQATSAGHSGPEPSIPETILLDQTPARTNTIDTTQMATLPMTKEDDANLLSFVSVATGKVQARLQAFRMRLSELKHDTTLRNQEIRYAEQRLQELHEEEEQCEQTKEEEIARFIQQKEQECEMKRAQLEMQMEECESSRTQREELVRRNENKARKMEAHITKWRQRLADMFEEDDDDDEDED
jgi:hypothetical protein